MERLRSWWSRPPQRQYEPVGEHEEERDRGPIEPDDDIQSSGLLPVPEFSWVEYFIFLWMGVAMLWAWNMFLAAAPYFQGRFESNRWVASNFQSSILSVSCVTNLSSVLALAKLQKNASYPRRIRLSLLLNVFVCILLALSAISFRDVPVGVYFTFLLVMVFGASMATGMNQNGVFAYVSGFGQDRYMQAIMAGQGVAGVLPSIVQMVSVLAVPSEDQQVSPEAAQYQTSKSAFAYFCTAVGISASALVSFTYLDRGFRLRRRALTADLTPAEEDEEQTKRTKQSTPLHVLFGQLRWMASAVVICFAITMVYPVYAPQIESVRDDTTSSRLFQKPVFVPMAFLFWNVGDLLGRFLLLIPKFNLTAYPFTLFILSVARAGFIPLYLLCNVGGHGALVNSDAFYLFVVQLLFGVTNGFIGSSCMMGAADWVAPDQREAAGGFMGLMLVGGLSVGSLLSFFIGSS